MLSPLVKKELKQYADVKKAADLARFFKTAKGEYGEGDIFWGVKTPDIKKIVGLYCQKADLATLEELFASQVHEHRSVALGILKKKYQKAGAKEKKTYLNFYLKHAKAAINNWDLVDMSASHILGDWLLSNRQALDILENLARSKNIWQRRIAIIASFSFIKCGDFTPTLKIARLLINDNHDLIHKAVGWMLREVGKRDLSVEEAFLMKHYAYMPRTMLRYAIEKFPERKRQFYLKK